MTSALSLLFVFFLFWDGREQGQSNCLTKQMKNSPVMGIPNGIFHSTWNLGLFSTHSQELTHEKSLPLVSRKARMTGLGKFCFQIENILLHSIFTHSVNFLISVWGPKVRPLYLRCWNSCLERETHTQITLIHNNKGHKVMYACAGHVLELTKEDRVPTSPQPSSTDSERTP